jgi:hypothetical protein
LGLVSVLIALLTLWQVWSLTGTYTPAAKHSEASASGEPLEESGPVLPSLDEASTAPSVGASR